MNKFPHFEPDPFLWTKIQANIQGMEQVPTKPLVYWSMGVVVMALFALSWLAPAANQPATQHDFKSLNALYDE